MGCSSKAVNNSDLANVCSTWQLSCNSVYAYLRYQIFIKGIVASPTTYNFDDSPQQTSSQIGSFQTMDLLTIEILFLTLIHIVTAPNKAKTVQQQCRKSRNISKQGKLFSYARLNSDANVIYIRNLQSEMLRLKSCLIKPLMYNVGYLYGAFTRNPRHLRHCTC